ncbi:MAG TPA: PAS domain S-box protein [Xanthobacteraceae bacterium]|nr:PAS domain S-box protein [Xanthobacteraceae bacterium]
MFADAAHSFDVVRMLGPAVLSFAALSIAALVLWRRRRRAADTALRASEERYRTLYRHTPLPLHSLDSSGLIDQVSDAWLALLGYRRDEVIGRPLTDFMTAESTRERNEHYWPQLMSTGALREAEYRLIAKDGSILDCILSAAVERDAQGRVVHSLCGLVDVTERRRAEQALRQAQKLEAVGQLTGGIAHDFNNLLAVILGNLELARKRAPDDARLVRLIDNTVQAAQRGAALTQRMLAFARRQDLKPEPVDVPELVMDMADLLRRSIGPQVRIEMRFPLGLPRARVDANQLELALLNLAVNARDAMPDGGTIVIAASEREVREENAADEEAGAAGLPPGRYFCLSVSDNGSGMDGATLARATEPFFTTKGVGKGTGLGLAMVHGLAAQSGGRLTLTSAPGKGTTAEICLPIAPAQAAREPERAPTAVSLDPQTLSILVVDDDPLVLGATVATLEDLGYAVGEASSGLKALAQIEAGRFDVVLTDQAMPGMTGVQLADVIAARWPHIGVILGTGYAELPEGASPDLLRLGKPFGRDGLEWAIAAALRRRTGGNVVPLKPRSA